MTENRSGFDPQKAFAALRHRNFRLFWFGQCISLTGTWMQEIAQAWLVLELTKSAFWLGVVSAVQFLPMLLLSLYAGFVIDRFPKRNLLILTQSAMLVLAFLLALDTQLGTVNRWHVLIFAGLLGLVNTFDMPTRQSLMVELVGKEDLMNAIVLNSTVFNAARVIGPSVAGFALASLGTDSCFYLNALSFIPVIIGITLIRLERRPTAPVPLQTGVWADIQDGLRHIWKTPQILLPIALVAIINVFVLNFNVLVPLYAKNVFHGGAQDLGLLMSANGLGALAGAFLLTARGDNRPKTKTLAVAAAGICLAELFLVPVKSPLVAYLLLAMAGFAMIAFSTTANSLIQMQAPDHLRGRIMSVYALVFMGFTPFGSFLSGSVAHLWGAPAAFGLGAGISLLLVIALILNFAPLFRGESRLL